MERRMDRKMDENGIGSELDALFAEYRSACPDPDGGVNFMPGLWQKIEARRKESVSVFRRLAQACVLATAALTLAMVILIPRIQSRAGVHGHLRGCAGRRSLRGLSPVDG